jgi:hypothetical protein
MVAEAIANPNIGDTLIYVRDSWYHYFRKILKNKRIQHLPPIPIVGELKEISPITGAAAVMLFY